MGGVECNEKAIALACLASWIGSPSVGFAVL